MKYLPFGLALTLTLAATGVSRAAEPQTSQTGPSASAPAFVRLDGELKTATGEPRTGAVVLVVSLYAEQADTAALWFETQSITLDAAGHYTIFAGASQAEGLPREFFTSNAAQWIGVAVQGEPEQPRVRMLSVPYALSAGNADTLGGVPVTDFVMTENLAESVKTALKGDGAGIAGNDGNPTVMGTSGQIARFTTGGLAADIVDSVITESGNNIGIGTATPGSPLHVNAATMGVSGYAARIIDSNSTVGASLVIGATVLGPNFKNKILFVDSAGFHLGTVNDALSAAPTSQLMISPFGNVGLGTTGPASPLHVNAATIGTNYTARFIDGNSSIGASVVIGSTILGAGNRFKALFVDSNGLNFGTLPDTLNTSPASQMVISTTGNVGIGTANPTTKLQVVGDVIVSGNIGAKYQDVAEWVETTLPLEVGTVVIVDPLESDQVVASSRAYDTRVAGAVSRQPGLILGEAGEGKALIAQSGRVRIKVDASYGAIKQGDLLVTSPTPGHAMLSKPIKVSGQLIHRSGTLVGKALEALPRGKGEILVLLTLQ